MCIYSSKEEYKLTYCIYRTFLREPRLYYDDLGKGCGSCRNTVSKYWKLGLENLVFFPPQIRLKMFEERKEYIYLVQSDDANRLYEYFKHRDEAVYLSQLSGKFDILLQTNRPLDVLPDRTLFYGSRSDYIYPDTPNCSYETALDLMDKKLKGEYGKSTITIEYPPEPVNIGNPHYGWLIFPHLKYNLRTSYTDIVQTLHISFESFQKGLDYLFNVSTVLLPYYPLGFRLYSQYFFVFWSDHEKFLCELFGSLPCHVSITKVKDALIIYLSIQKGMDMSERLFSMCTTMVDLGLINRFWTSKPIHGWRRD